MEENWKQWKKNPFLKKMEEEKHEYEGGMIEEWNKEEDKKD